MGETDGARSKLDSYVELDEPGADPVTGRGAYDESSEKTAAVDLDELEPVDAPGWEEGVGQTEHLDLDDLQDATGGWNDQPLKTEAVELEDLEVLEKLDPKVSNAPPALPDVGERVSVPRAPLPTRRKKAKAAAPKPKSKPKAAPPPPPTRAESLEDAPKPMIGSDGWIAEDRISVVDFSAVLSAPAAPKKGEPTEKMIVLGTPLQAPLPAAPPEEKGSNAGKIVLVLLLLVGVGAGAYFLGRQDTSEPIAEADDAPVVDETDTEPDVREDAPETDDPETDDPEATETDEDQPEVREPATAMRETPREATAMSTMAAEPTRVAEPTMEPTMAAEPTTEPEPTMVAEPTMAPMEAAPTNLPDHPSREQVQAALTAIRPQVAECLEGQHATVRVRITVRNSGRVTTAVVQDSLYARPPVGSCIARTVRRARFPEFSEDTFVVLYPFQL